MKNDRQTALRQHLYRHGSASIGELAAVMGASVATVRRDLQALEEQGVLARTHGGAQLIAGSVGVDVAFKVREQQHLGAKRAIAAAAYRRLVPDSRIMLDAGTTTLQLAKLIHLAPLPLTVITNGLTIAQELVDVPAVTVIMLAGQLRNENLSLVGPLAEAVMERLSLDQLFLGVTAISPDLRIFGRDSTEARLNEKMLGCARERFVLADSSKFGARGSFLVASLRQAGELLCDQGLAEPWRQRLSQAGLGVTLVDDAAAVLPMRAAS